MKVKFWSEIVGRYVVKACGYDEVDEKRYFEFDVEISSTCLNYDKCDCIDMLVHCHCMLLGLRWAELCSIDKKID